MLQDEWLDEARAAEIARKVREELARRRISRQALADLARISISTLEKALSGQPLLHPGDGDPAGGGARHLAARRGAGAGRAASGAAPDELGGYGHGAVRWLEGRYLTLRPLFGADPGIHAYLVTIGWDEASSRLLFAESERLDNFAQHGAVSLPPPFRPYLSGDQRGRPVSAGDPRPADHRRLALRHPHHPPGRPWLAARAGRLPDRLAPDRRGRGAGVRQDRAGPSRLSPPTAPSSMR